MGIIPKESEARTEQGSAEYRKFAAARNVQDLQIVGDDLVPAQVYKHGVGSRRDTDEADRQPVETVREVHRIGRPDKHDYNEGDIEPPQVYQQAFYERHREMRDVRIGRIIVEEESDNQGCCDLEREFVFGPEAGGSLLHYFQIVVPESDAAEGERRKEDHPHVLVGEVGPEHGGTHERSYNQNPAHGRRSLLVQMGLGPVIAHLLPHLQPAEPGDYPRPEGKAHDERRDHGAGAPERYVLEYVETAEYVVQRIQKMIEH